MIFLIQTSCGSSLLLYFVIKPVSEKFLTHCFVFGDCVKVKVKVLRIDNTAKPQEGILHMIHPSKHINFGLNQLQERFHDFLQ